MCNKKSKLKHYISKVPYLLWDKDFRKSDCSKESVPENPFFYTTKYMEPYLTANNNRQA